MDATAPRFPSASRGGMEVVLSPLAATDAFLFIARRAAGSVEPVRFNRRGS
jgi:hypothetical protein